MRILLLALSLIFAVIAPAHAQRGGGANPDTFYLNDTGIRDYLNCDTSTKTPLSPVLNPATKIAFLMIGGQSNSTNIGDGTYTPVNASNIFNFNICDGGLYSASDPLVGTGFVDFTRPGHIGLPIADALISSGKFAQVVLVPFGFGGSSIQDWATGSLSTRVAAMLGRMAQRGYAASANWALAVLFAQGESDTGLGTSQVNYTARGNVVIGQFRAAGYTGRILFARESLNLGVTSAAVQAAQWSNTPSGLIDPPNNVFKGADMDALVGNICGVSGTAACVQADQTHKSAAGQYSGGFNGTYGWPQALAASGSPF